MTLNLSQRVAYMSALVLDVEPDAPEAVVVAALTEKLGESATPWLATGARHMPDDRHLARMVAAARFMTGPAQHRSSAVVAFLNADQHLPEIDRMVPPVPDGPNRHYQPALVA